MFNGTRRRGCKLVATPTVQNMISRNKLKAVCVLCCAVLICGCGNVSESLSPDYHEKKGLAYFEQGDLDKAEEEFKLAISLTARTSGPKAGPVGRMNTELADLYKKQNKLDFADEGYRRALIVFSEKPELLNDADREAWVKCLRDYAEVLRATGRNDEATIRESQAERILEKMGKAAPAKTEAAPSAEKTVEPSATTTSQSQPQGQPETKTATPEQATPGKAASDKPAAGTQPEQPETKPAPAKTETKAPADKPVSDKPPAKAQPEQPQTKSAPAKTGAKAPAAKTAPSKEAAKTK